MDEKPTLDATETPKSVAVLLCGLPRTFRETAPNLCEKLIEPNDDWRFDFFLNTSHRQTSTKNQDLDAKYNDQFSTADELLSDLRAAYEQVVDIELLESECEEFPQSLFNEDKRNFYSYRCYRALRTCLEYANRTDVDYDLFVCARFDITFTRSIDFDEFRTARQLSFIPSVSLRPGHFHIRDIDFCCLGDRDSITEWTRYWTYRPDIVPYFDSTPVPTARPASAKGHGTGRSSRRNGLPTRTDSLQTVPRIIYPSISKRPSHAGFSPNCSDKSLQCLHSLLET